MNKVTVLLYKRLRQVETALAEAEQELRERSNNFLGLKEQQSHLKEALRLLESPSPGGGAASENFVG